MSEYFYRFEETPLYEGSDYAVGVELRLRKFPILRHTPSGVRISDGSEGGRFINVHAKKKFASPTPQLAFKDYLARKQRHKEVLVSQLEHVTAALRLTPDQSKQYFDDLLGGVMQSPTERVAERL